MDRRQFIKSTSAGAAGLAFGETILAAKDDHGPGDFVLADRLGVADVLFDLNDHEVVGVAATALARDVESVTGKTCSLNEGSSPNAVVAGTIGKSELVDALIHDGRLDASEVAGQWESCLFSVVKKPFPGVDEALVIAGSDRRGTAFGIFELSRQIGVSPWIFWADAVPDKREGLVIKGGSRRLGPPSVKYRGIFINDEDFGLQPWSAKTFEAELGDIGPKTYARVFELLLRLKANHIWPAMHKCTKAFNFYPDNKIVADRYAIVMGSSHCEQMLRNNVSEWKPDGKGPYIYQVNREGVLDYWEERVKENGRYENVYTLGMRGLHDSPMFAVGSRRTKIKLYEKIIADQRDILRRGVDRDVSRVPQIFCAYNEMLDFYRDGLPIPEDATMMWVDDNHGYIRGLSGPLEQGREGGSGVYYHISYWGPPFDYLWLCSTPPALIWEEMRKAYAHDARRVWMLNVGDIKPGELMTEFFLDLAWDVDKWDRKKPADFLLEAAEREFGPDKAREIADVMNEYFRLNFQRKPEHMGFNMIGEKGIPVNDPEFTPFHYGDEAQKRIDAYADLDKRATLVYEELPEHKRASFYQLVLYPVRGSSLLNSMTLNAYKSRIYAAQGRKSAKDYAIKSREAHKGLREEDAYYNEVLSKGKWKYMMCHHPKDLSVFDQPKTAKARLKTGPALGIFIEGMENGRGVSGGELPEFNALTRRKYFIDVFNRGDRPLEWRAYPSEEWILLDKDHGTADGEERIWVDIDYGQAPKGEALAASVEIKGADDSRLVKITAYNPAYAGTAGTLFVEDNKVVAMDAGSGLTGRTGNRGSRWESIRGLGRSGKAIALLPLDSPTLKDNEISDAALAEYPVRVITGGEARLIFEVLPTYPIHEGRELALAFSFDDLGPRKINLEKKGRTLLGFYWGEDVLAGYFQSSTQVNLAKGDHSLKLWGLDPSVVVDRIVIDFGGLKKSCLGPPETIARV